MKFTSPLLLDDLTLVSRPCTYIDYAVEKKENCDVRVDFVVASDPVSYTHLAKRRNCRTCVGTAGLQLPAADVAAGRHAALRPGAKGICGV